VRCPKHIEKYVCGFDDPANFLNYECNDYAACYLVRCKCAREEFRIYLSAVPSVLAQCIECGNMIRLYDVRLYPAATPRSEATGPLDAFRHDGRDVFSVCVVYEYGELDDDESFDQDDISWCEVYAFVAGTNIRVRVLSDETT